MKRNFLILFVSLLVLVMGFAQIGFAQLAEDIPREETLIADVPHGRVPAPDSFNFFTISWNVPSKGAQQLMLEPLWIVEYATGEVINALAAEGPIYNEDFTQMTVKLREGCHWSDGVPITADDIVYGIETAMNHPGMAYSDQFNLYIDQVYKTDDYTVVFELKEPNARFHTNFLDRWGCWRPFPKHIFEKVEDPVSFGFNPPVSSGPYVLKDYDRAGYWTLWERREDWDKTPTGILYGMPKPKYVLFYCYGDVTNRVIAQTNHNLDMAEHTTESFRALISGCETARGYYETFPFAEVLHPCITGITFNNDVSPYNLKDVRWALTLAIDIVDYVSIAYDGIAAVGALHVAPTLPNYKWYYEPLEEWLENFTLDIEVDGEPFKPYDSEVPFKLAESAKSRGYDVPEDPEKIREIFGRGWWKYAPDVAEQLLLRNGFTKDENGKWLLPDGTPWKITILANPSPVHQAYRNSLAAAQEWRNFGIDVTLSSTEAQSTLVTVGDFEVTDSWPATENWGGHFDLHHTLSSWYSKYYRPIGENTAGHASRWTDPRMDKIIEDIQKLDWDDPKSLELGLEGLKIAVEEMPGIPTFACLTFLGWDEYYWTNYPGGENPYTQPHYHWPNFKYMLPFLEPVER